MLLTDEGREFRDHALSFEPNEISELVSELKFIKSSLGSLNKKPTAAEQKNRLAYRKGLVFSRELKLGSVINANDIMFARPAKHFTSNQKNEVLGRTLSRNVVAGELVSEDILLKLNDVYPIIFKERKIEDSSAYPRLLITPFLLKS